jgi:biopolymer transport protein ExbD
MPYRRSKRPIAIEDSSINLTPLIDVVFVVLIIFILIAPMLEIDRVELSQSAKLSERQSASAPDTKMVSIHVHQDNSIWINGKRAPLEDLASILTLARKQGSLKTVQLYHDKSAHFGTYQLVKNAVEEAGFEELDVILKPG